MSNELKKQIVQYLVSKDVLVDRTLLEKINEKNINLIYKTIFSNEFLFSKEHFDRLLVDDSEEKDAESNTSEQNFQKNDVGSVRVVYTYADKMEKKDVSSFTKYFNARYKTLRGILQNRQELTNPISINRIIDKKEKDAVCTVGMVFEKEISKSGNVILTLEDPTGTIKVLISKDKKEIFELAKNLVVDEVIGINGVSGGKIVFANNVFVPDVPLTKEFKKSPDEVYGVVLSDLHVGSTLFLEQDFLKFIAWLNGEAGNAKQKEIAKKVKYIFVLGDLVDGVGIYATQQSELNIPDITKQYDKCAELLDMIPKNIQILVIPGNHDAVRLTEPQPVLVKDYGKKLWEIENITMLTNPAYVNVHFSDDFPGFDVLMYHGYSYDYFADKVESIRQKRPNISDRGDLVQKFLLQRRHLAPSHSATLYIQDPEKDPLIIDRVPDFFMSGHIHKASVSNYRNVTTVSGSCFQAKTPFQEKVGHEPEPGRVPLINFQTREVKMLKFESEKEEKEEKDQKEELQKKENEESSLNSEDKK